jgi:hypothetical protein
MAWYEGKQNLQPKWSANLANEEIKKVKGNLTDKESRMLLTKFLSTNITYATDLLMGIKLYPFQHMMIKTMMESDYVMTILSRGGGKCSKWDSLVPTNKGIKQIINCEVGDLVLTENGLKG